MLQESMEAAQALGDGELGLDDATSVAGLGMAALGAFLDPAGALVGAALGPLLDWVANNVSFVKEPLDLLLGDPPEIMTYAAGWEAASQQLAAQATRHAQLVASEIPVWRGPGRDAYVKVQQNVGQTLQSSARLAQTMGTAVKVAGGIVAVLRELVWGLIKELVISLVTNAVIAAASAIPTVGASLAAYTAWASAKVAMVLGKVAKGISKVFAKLSKLTSKIGPLSRMFAKAADAFARMGAKAAGAAARAGRAAPDSPDGPSGPPPSSPNGPRSSDTPEGPRPAGPPFGDPEPVANPSTPASSADHPYLRPGDTTPETQAAPGLPERIGADAPDQVPEGWPELDERALQTFGETPRPETWPAGETRYRVVGDGQRPDGEFWTRTPPANDDYLRSDMAVLNEWNGNHGVVAYSPTQDIPVWVGPAGPQIGTGSTPDNPFHLPGGGEQIFVPRGTIPDAGAGGADRWLIQQTPW
ncbi:hypothetical protein [Mariniluteicoccus flavus]